MSYVGVVGDRQYDVECPYCGEGEDICHDDGQGYSEDDTHQQDCGSCGKTFVFATYTRFSYNVAKADCLNGGEHQFKSPVVNRYYSLEYCKDCGKEKRTMIEEKS